MSTLADPAFTQSTVDAVPLLNGVRTYPAGVYPANLTFPAYASFGAWASFGEGARFGERASFGAWASFGARARFGVGASFGEGASFGAGTRFGARASFGAWASFGAGVSFGEGASFAPFCAWGPDCVATAPYWEYLTAPPFKVEGKIQITKELVEYWAERLREHDVELTKQRATFVDELRACPAVVQLATARGLTPGERAMLASWLGGEASLRPAERLSHERSRLVDLGEPVKLSGADHDEDKA